MALLVIVVVVATVEVVVVTGQEVATPVDLTGTKVVMVVAAVTAVDTVVAQVRHENLLISISQ